MKLAKNLWKRLLHGQHAGQRRPAACRTNVRQLLGLEPLETRQMLAVSLGVSGSPLAESGGSAVVSAELSAALENAVTLDLQFTGTASMGSDYSASALSITIPAGSTSGSVTLETIDNAMYQGDRTIIVTMANVVGDTLGDTQQVAATIAENETSPLVVLALAGSPLAENGGVATVTASLSVATTSTVTVDLSFGGSAVLDGHYTASSASISIPAGSTTGSVTLTGRDDAVYTGSRTIVVEIETVTNGQEDGTQLVTATLTDDESPVPDAPTSVTLAATSQLAAHVSFTLSATPSIVVTAATGKTVKVLVNGLSAATASESSAGQYTASLPTGSLQVGANTITAVTSDSGGDSIASTALTVTYAPSFTQLYVVPGSVGASTTISVALTSRLAAFRNEVGYLVADDATGAVNGLTPGASGFAQAAMSKATALFAGSAEAGTTQSITLQGGQYVVLYLVQDNSAAGFLAANPANTVSGSVVTFFSLDAANPDAVRHTVTVGDATTGNMQYAWEDLTGGGDSDYNDLVITLTPATTAGQTGAALRVAGDSTESVAASFTLESGQKTNNASNDASALAGEVGVYYVDDSAGTVDGLKPGDSGYVAAALASANRQTVFSSGSAPGVQNSLSLSGGTLLAFYSISTGTAADFLTANSANAATGTAVAFFSFDTANTDTQNHFRWYSAEQTARTTPSANATSDERLLQIMNTVFGREQDFSDYRIKVDLG